MTEVLDVACDEAGHTGPDLLHPDQRYFAFASVAVGDEEAWQLIEKARRNNPVQMPELKAAKLMRSQRGCALASELVRAVDGRLAVNVHDKLLALCGWVFEYIYEPVYQDDPSLLYEKNFHRFVAMFAWLWFNEAGSDAEEAIRQFQKYMRTLDQADAPLLFERTYVPLSEDGREHPFELILRFARGYRHLIATDNSRIRTVMPDGGRWTLDLSAAGLWSHLNHWGRQRRPLCVRCDASKPLEAIAAQFTGEAIDPGIARARYHHKNADQLGWRLAEPIAFGDSRNHPAVQIADVVAGAAAALFSAGKVPQGLEEMSAVIEKHILCDSILPNPEVIDLKGRPAAVNALILYDLAKRAEFASDPHQGLAEMYRAAEIGWVRGELRPGMQGA
ncbi:MAG: DUF3800 domain-containing protein [bacterium]|nr:DUF3800 domain-containing protein [bacterium]